MSPLTSDNGTFCEVPTGFGIFLLVGVDRKLSPEFQNDADEPNRTLRRPGSAFLALALAGERAQWYSI